MTFLTRQEARAALAGNKRNKYGAKRTTIDGVTYDSNAEALFGEQLRLREKAREVTEIERQKKFELAVHGIRIGEYRADFVFWDFVECRYRIIDVKGHDTPLSKWKRKHVKAQYGIEVEIVK